MPVEAVQDWRARLVSHLSKEGFIRSEAVREAFLKVPRHLFLAGAVDEGEAYLDQVVELVPGLSTASQPSVVAMMLEELAVETGQRVLEVGTASGYNAALLAELTGNGGLVYTVEFDADLAAQAERKLWEAGYAGVHVRCGDGARGYPEGAPFARICVTAAMANVAHSLLKQLAPGGVFLSPLEVAGLPELMLRLTPTGESVERFEGRFVGFPVTFVPLRGEYGGDSAGSQARGRLLSEALSAIRDRAWVEGWRFGLGDQLAVGLYAACTLAGGVLTEPATLAGQAVDRWLRDERPEVSELTVEAMPATAPTKEGHWILAGDYRLQVSRRREVSS